MATRHEYFQAKKRKIEEQRVNDAPMISDLFKGEVFWLDGLSEQPLSGMSHDALVRLITQHGGNVINTDSKAVTIVLYRGRTHAQLEKEKKSTRRKRKWFVKPEWVKECITSGKKINPEKQSRNKLFQFGAKSTKLYQIHISNLFQVISNAEPHTVVALHGVVIWRGRNTLNRVRDGSTYIEASKLLGKDYVIRCSKEQLKKSSSEIQHQLEVSFDSVIQTKFDTFIVSAPSDGNIVEIIQSKLNPRLEFRVAEYCDGADPDFLRAIRDHGKPQIVERRVMKGAMKSRNDLISTISILIQILIDKNEGLQSKVHGRIWELWVAHHDQRTPTRASQLENDISKDAMVLARILVSDFDVSQISKLEGVAIRIQSTQLAPQTQTSVLTNHARVVKSKIHPLSAEKTEPATSNSLMIIDDSITNIKLEIQAYLQRSENQDRIVETLSTLIDVLIRTKQLFKAATGMRMIAFELSKTGIEHPALPRITKHIQQACHETYGAELKW